MKRYERDLLVVLVYSHIILDLCNGEPSSMILFRMKKASTHYKIYMRNDYNMDLDPLNAYSISQDAMQELCDNVHNAKKFFDLKYRWKEVNRLSTYNPLGLHLQEDRPMSSSARSKLEIQECLTRQRWGEAKLKCLPCTRLDTASTEYFIVSGRVNEFMYLLEPSNSERNNGTQFRLTSLIEQSAVLRSVRSFLYFHSQFRTSRGKMERICNAKREDRIRLCSAVFDALATENLRSKNFLKSRNHCTRCVVKGKNLKVIANFLPCEIIIDGSPSKKSLFEKIFVLADSREQGAAFVLRYAEKKTKDGGLPALRLHAHIEKIGVFFHPIDDGEKMGRTGAENMDNLKPTIFKRRQSRRRRKPLVEHQQQREACPR